MLCCVDVSARNTVTRRAQGVRRGTRRAGVFTGARCVDVWERVVVCLV